MKKRIAGIFLSTAILAASSLSAMAAPVLKDDGTIFDAEYYAAKYPDIAAQLGNNADLLYKHYIWYGKAEGREAAAPGAQPATAATTSTVNYTFDYKYYADRYPDLKYTYGYDEAKLWAHYVEHGMAEGRYCSLQKEVDAAAAAQNAARAKTSADQAKAEAAKQAAAESAKNQELNIKAVYNYINHERRTHGVSAFEWSPSLAPYAQERAVALVQDYNSVDWNKILSKNGFHPEHSEELILRGNYNAAEAVDYWMENAVTRTHLVTKTFCKIAVGHCYVNGIHYWEVMLTD